jgi:hypothetical protein
MLSFIKQTKAGTIDIIDETRNLDAISFDKAVEAKK